MSVGLGGLFAALVLVADLYAIVRTVRSCAAPLAKTLWVGAVLLFPVLGVVVWILFGPS